METVGAYGTMVAAFGVGLFCLGAGMFISWLVRPQHLTPLKLEPYECGEPTVGTDQVRFRTLFYLFAIVFVIFDVEAIFLFPGPWSSGPWGCLHFWKCSVFVAILLLGLAYAWKKGVLRWQ